jgi:hypothetical protein
MSNDTARPGDTAKSGGGGRRGAAGECSHCCKRADMFHFVYDKV